MFSYRTSRFSHFLRVCVLLSLAGASLTGCAAWLQGDSAQEKINSELTDAGLGDLTAFINSERALEMLSTEPLQNRLKTLANKNQEWFNTSREVLLPVTQIMQGYILSEGHSLANDKRSLVLIDPDRDNLMLVLVNLTSKKITVLNKGLAGSDPQAVAEMQEYAENWGLGQLGMAE